MTVNVRKGKLLTFGYVAPCALIYHSAPEAPEINQYDGNMVVLLSVWKTRCSNPRLDIILWLPWEADGHRIVLVKGPECGNFLKGRYCEPSETFDLKTALR